MLIKSATFVTSLIRPDDFQGRGLPEIVVVGKSNVGKSSLINRLLGNSHLARTSGEPGKTRLINIYAVNGLFHLVDLPGYGFARVSRDEKMRWADMIEQYLTGSGHIRMALQLVDLRHSPTEDDMAMVAYLRHYGIPFAVAATKADKLSRAARGRAIPVICRALAAQPWDVIPFSSVDGSGRDELLKRIEAAILPESE